MAPDNDSDAEESDDGQYQSIIVQEPRTNYEIDIRTRISAIDTLYDLWSHENQMKSQIIYVYVLVQSILITGYVYTDSNQNLVQILTFEVPGVLLLVSLVGITTSWMTLASVGRSVAFQKTWKKKRAGLIESSPEIIKKSYGFYPTTEDKQNMPWYGSIGSKSLLLSPPVLGLFLWLILLFTSIFF